MLVHSLILNNCVYVAGAQRSEFSEGDEIEGNFRDEGAWYPGVVFKVEIVLNCRLSRWSRHNSIWDNCVGADAVLLRTFRDNIIRMPQVHDNGELHIKYSDGDEEK